MVTFRANDARQLRTPASTQRGLKPTTHACTFIPPAAPNTRLDSERIETARRNNMFLYIHYSPNTRLDSERIETASPFAVDAVQRLTPNTRLDSERIETSVFLYIHYSISPSSEHPPRLRED